MSEKVRIAIYVNGEELAKHVTRYQQQLRKRNPTQRRGPNAAAEQRISEKWYSRASLGAKLQYWIRKAEGRS